MTRYHKKTKEVEPEIKEVTERGEQLAGDCRREGQSLCLNRVRLGKNHRVSGGRGLSLACAEPRGNRHAVPAERGWEGKRGGRLSAGRAGQAAQKAPVQAGTPGQSRSRAACGRRMGRGWYICPAVLPHTEGDPHPTQAHTQPSAWPDREAVPVPALALGDLGLAFRVHKTGGHAPALPPSLRPPPLSPAPGAVGAPVSLSLGPCWSVSRTFCILSGTQGASAPRLQP